MIVVAGATGMLGGHLIWFLLQKYPSIKALKRKSSTLDCLHSILNYYYTNPHEYLSRIVWVDVDLTDVDSVASALAGATLVYHCAAEVTLVGNNKILSDSNVTITQNLVDACLKNGVNAFCFVSSIASCVTVGGSGYIDESSAWLELEDQSYYSKSKYLSEQVVWSAMERGLRAVIVNPGVILGYSGKNEGSSKLFYQVKNGFYFYTSGGSGYVDVEDVVKIMIKLVQTGVIGQRFILVSENMTHKQVLSTIAVGLGKMKPFIFVSKFFLIPLSHVLERIAKLMNKTPLLTVSMARVASQHKYYSSEKVRVLLNYKFKPVQVGIIEICKHI